LHPDDLKPCKFAVKPVCDRTHGQPLTGRPPDGELDPDMLRASSIIAVHDQGVHLPNVKVGVQRLKGQKRIEMRY
jgi:hypothetical protein